MHKRAIIFGIKKYSLTTKEKILFKKAKPWGIILFSRNIKSFTQLKNLVSDIFKACDMGIFIELLCAIK